MSTAFRYIKASAVFPRKNERRPLAVRWGILPQIDDDIPYGSLVATEDFCLLMRRVLEMQPADRSSYFRIGDAVLDKVCLQSPCRELFFTEGSGKKAARI